MANNFFYNYYQNLTKLLYLNNYLDIFEDLKKISKKLILTKRKKKEFLL